MIERWFDAPRDLVWKATTTAQLVKRWWAPSFTTMVSCEMDVRVGGKWRFALRSSQGDEVVFSGEYLELAPPSRLVQTWRYEPIGARGAVETAVYTAEGNRTKLTLEAVYPNMFMRDGAFNSGMEKGVHDTHRQLEELIRSL